MHTTVSFGNVHTPYRLRHITAGSQSVPQFVEIVCNILVKPGQCLSVNACCPTVGFYSFISFPYLSFTYRKWLCRFYCSPPTCIVARGCRSTISTMGQTFCSGPITVLHRYYGLLRPCTPHWYSGAHGAFTCASLHIGTTGSHVPCKSLCCAHAACMPDADQPVTR